MRINIIKPKKKKAEAEEENGLNRNLRYDTSVLRLSPFFFFSFIDLMHSLRHWGIHKVIFKDHKII